MHCDDLGGRDGDGGVGGMLKRKRIYVYTQLIHIVVQQKLTQHCKEIILQFKKNFFNKNRRKKKSIAALISLFHISSHLPRLHRPWK